MPLQAQIQLIFSSHIYSSAVQFLQGCNFDDYFRIKMGLNFFKPSATANGAVLSKKIVTGYYSIYDV